MKVSELRAKALTELEKELKDKLKELEKVTQDVYKGKEKNIVKTRQLRKDVARIKTLITEKNYMEGLTNA